jgi:hypothetical protein
LIQREPERDRATPTARSRQIATAPAQRDTTGPPLAFPGSAAPRLRDPGGPRANPRSHAIPAQDRAIRGLLKHADPGRVSRRHLPPQPGNRSLQPLGYHALAGQDPVEIYVLSDRNAYGHFLKFYYPELPPRRAFFLAQGERRVVYTYLSDRLEEDLRHEVAHALLRGCYGDLPLWLDEGLAEYFETRADIVDIQDEHISKIPQDLRNGWVPDLPRLESFTDIHQMSVRDYREAWAWVHLMLEDRKVGKNLLLDYLEKNRNGKRPRPLSQTLAAQGTTGKTLLAHLDQVQSQVLARKPEPPPQDRSIRFQDRGNEVKDRSADTGNVTTDLADRPAPSSRPNFFRRLAMLMGL